MTRIHIAYLLSLLSTSGWAQVATEHLTFEARSGTAVDADRGFIVVPENRSDPDSRRIELHFVRFPSTAEEPGAPIIFLAGGPGGSGISAARGLFPLFMGMREFGDVIALDQRGTGLSNAVPECVTDHRIPITEPFVFDQAALLLRLAAEDCALFWRDQNIDLAGYNSVESAHDIEDLRRALGAGQVSLWGVSYGARLAITALREMPGRIDRIVLAAVEPPHATIKLPASLDAHVARLQAVLDADPAAPASYANIAGLMRRAHERLDVEPLQLTAPDGTGATASFLFGGKEMRLLGAGGLADRVLPRFRGRFKNSFRARGDSFLGRLRTCESSGDTSPWTLQGRSTMAGSRTPRPYPGSGRSASGGDATRTTTGGPQLLLD